MLFDKVDELINALRSREGSAERFCWRKSAMGLRDFAEISARDLWALEPVADPHFKNPLMSGIAPCWEQT